jgi:hypothetical protein
MAVKVLAAPTAETYRVRSPVFPEVPGAATLRAPDVAIVIDITGSMVDELDSVKIAVSSYIDDVIANLPPDVTRR